MAGSAVAGSKRARVSQDEIEEMEGVAKRHMANMQESKGRITWAAPLLAAGDNICLLTVYADNLKCSQRQLASTLHDLHRSTVVNCEAAGHAALDAARSALTALDRLEDTSKGEALSAIPNTSR